MRMRNGGIPLQSLQIGTHVRSTAVPEISIFFECLIYDAFEFCGRLFIQTYRSHWLFCEDRFQYLSCVFSGEGELPRYHFIQNHAERKEIRAGINRKRV